MTVAEQRTGLLLEPLDTLFFRDGRPFSAGRARSGLPVPQTLMGAVRTHLLSLYGADFSALGRAVKSGATLEEAIRQAGAPGWIASVAVRGPWLARKGNRPTLWLEVPRHLRPGPGETRVPLKPRREKLPGWRSEDDLLPLWNGDVVREKKSEPGYLSFDALPACLNGENLPRTAFLPAAALYAYDDKIGIAVDPVTCVAADEMIYSTRMLVLAPGVCLYAEVTAPQGSGLTGLFAAPGVMAFGGESRYVTRTAIEPLNWPEATGERRLLILAAPAPFRCGSRPDVLPRGARLVSAAVDGPFAVSGWDMARGGPKPTRFGVRSGSVYFIEDGAAGAPASLCASPEDVQQGYGYYLQGVWNYA